MDTHQAKSAERVLRLLDIMARLRSDGGCPWDREQTLESLKPYLVEEAYEVLDAIDSGSPEKHAEELGDLLLQIVFQSEIRREQGRFDFGDVADVLIEKLVRRHPHVFGDAQVSDSSEVLRNWQAIKAREKPAGQGSVLGESPRQLPALQKAETVQTRAARVGFDWSDVRDVIAKVDEELGEVREAVAGGDSRAVKDELGDLLFAVVNVARFLNVDAEDALRGTVLKFVRRFQKVESEVRGQGKALSDCTLEEMDRIWEQAKADEVDPRQSGP